MSWDIYVLDDKPTEVECDQCGNKKMEYLSIWDDNITYNLSAMARECGLWHVMFNPEIAGMKIGRLLPQLETAINQLENDPDFYKDFNPKNGWGTYEDLLKTAKEFLEIVKEYPETTIHIS